MLAITDKKKNFKKQVETYTEKYKHDDHVQAHLFPEVKDWEDMRSRMHLTLNEVHSSYSWY